PGGSGSAPSRPQAPVTPPLGPRPEARGREAGPRAPLPAPINLPLPRDRALPNGAAGHCKPCALLGCRRATSTGASWNTSAYIVAPRGRPEWHGHKGGASSAQVSKLDTCSRSTAPTFAAGQESRVGQNSKRRCRMPDQTARVGVKFEPEGSGLDDL